MDNKTKVNRCEILTVVLCHQSYPRPALFTVNSYLMTACDTVTLNPMSVVLLGLPVITFPSMQCWPLW